MQEKWEYVYINRKRTKINYNNFEFKTYSRPPLKNAHAYCIGESLAYKTLSHFFNYSGHWGKIACVPI